MLKKIMVVSMLLTLLLSDCSTLSSVKNAQGSGLIRGAYRTILLMKKDDKIIFAHGFAKGEKDNITKNELEDFKMMAETFLNLSQTQIDTLIDNKNLIELLND